MGTRYNLKATNKMREIARRYGAKVLSPSYSEIGWPDRLIVGKNGVTIWVEIKSKTDKLSPKQSEVLNMLSEYGHYVIMAKEGEEERWMSEINRILKYAEDYFNHIDIDEAQRKEFFI